MEPISTSFDLAMLIPQVILALGGIAMLLASFTRKADELAPYLSLGVLGLAAWATAAQWGTQSLPGAALAVDPFSVLFNLLLLGAAAMSCLISADYLGSQYELRTEYYALLLFAVLGMSALVGSTNFVMLFVGLEVFSVALYLLVAFTRNRSTSLEGAMKYFFLGAFSSCFILYGMTLIYGSTRSLDINVIGELLLRRGGEPDQLLFAGIGLLIVGMGFKIGVAPFHFWIPDVYEGAPASVTAFMSAATKVAAFAALLRVLHVGFSGAEFAERWMPLLAVLAALTMTVANVVALAQSNLKRLLAYSSIAHAGYVLLAVATNTVQGVEGLTFYLLAYVFPNLGAFAVAVCVGRGDPGREQGYRLIDLTGLSRRRPMLAAGMTVFMLSLAGIPPTAGFLGKWLIFRAALDANMLGFAVVMAVNSAIAAYYYLGVVARMYMRPEEEALPTPSVSAPVAVSAIVAVVVTFWLGVFPARALAVVNEVALRFWGTLHNI